MNWLKIKEGWTKAKNYVIIFLILVLGVFVFFVKRGDKNLFSELLDKRREKMDKELEIIKQAQEKKKQAEAENLEKYNQTVEKIEKEFAKSQEELSKKEKKEIETLVKKIDADPEFIAKKIAEKYGWEYIQ